MCSLCGILGGRGHWTESASHPEVFESRTDVHTPRRERQARVRLINQILHHYGLTLADWAGSSYILRSRTGQSAIVNNLAELWPQAEKLSKKTCDPLAAALLDTLEIRG